MEKVQLINLRTFQKLEKKLRNLESFRRILPSGSQVLVADFIYYFVQLVYLTQDRRRYRRVRLLDTPASGIIARARLDAYRGETRCVGVTIPAQILACSLISSSSRPSYFGWICSESTFRLTCYLLSFRKTSSSHALTCFTLMPLTPLLYPAGLHIPILANIYFLLKASQFYIVIW